MLTDMADLLHVRGVEFEVKALLGKGKGGYSYLVERDGTSFVIKQIHHEPCDYYTFGNKLESELRDYKTLADIGIKMPKMLDVDHENERILKEFIDGDTILVLVEQGKMKECYFSQVREMASVLKLNNLNIDYYPTNFIPQGDVLYYVDYECNQYSDEWNFENWGIKYWKK